ncbi:MAG: zinc ribbon domain-containing protein [Syntrophomonadaceae bacterium]|nr:zinc ribbon domain-containing protein [Syntrophomonadaceae bacterium]
MPTYTFECNKCGQFDIKLRVDQRNLGKCPVCNSKLKRIFNPNPNFYAFGSNWFTERRSQAKAMDIDDLEDPNFKRSKINMDDFMESYKEKRWGTKNPDPETIIGDLSDSNL